MKATLKFLQDSFNKFNREIFNDRLPDPLMHISSARSFMGQFRAERVTGILRSKRKYHLTLSNRYDLEEKILEDIVIHEMIHFIISYDRRKDSSAHGPVFKSLMNEINRVHRRNVTVSHHCTKAQLDSDTSKAHSIICVCTLTDGRKLISRVSQSKVFEIHKAFQDWDKVVAEEWFWVYGSYFNRYRRVLTPRLFEVDQEGLEIIESGTRLEFADGSGGRTILRPAKPTLR